MSKITKKENGFTLLEVMIATAIFVVAMVPLVGFFSAGFKINSNNSKKIIATYIAQELMEQIISKNFEEPFTFGSAIGPEEGLVDFDDVDDYDNTNTSHPLYYYILAPDSNHIYEYEPYRSIIRVTRFGGNLQPDSTISAPLKQIVVEVYQVNPKPGATTEDERRRILSPYGTYAPPLVRLVAFKHRQ
jgi:prepilin-type N-terminal cleavage/methylation domain-containing protein